METLPPWQKLLSDRGILGAALEAKWTPNGTGWHYPTGSGGTRWKAYDSGAKPKYLWETGSVGTCKYYILPGTQDAIAESMGNLIWASGEPDVLALRSAGAKNVLCAFGEQNLPSTVGADLKALGVTIVDAYPDLDATGLSAIHKLNDRLHESSIGLRAFHLPAPDGSKYDLNRLWIDCRFNQDKFWDAIVTCQLIELIYTPKQQALTRQELPAAFYDAIERALGVGDYLSTGWSKPIRCPLKDHEHDSGAPAAAWHKDKHILHCFKCHTESEHALAIDVGEKLGLDWRSFLPPKPVSLPLPARQKAAGQPRIVFGWGETTDAVIARLMSDDPGAPEALPLRWMNVRKFGGYADLMDAGKVLAIVGDSGDGKTSCIETQIDEWRRTGHSGIIFGPEWSREQYVMRAIQRRGGPSLHEIRKHETWKKLKARGVADDHNYGQRLDKDRLDYAVAIAKEVNAWPGKLWFVERMGLPIEKAISSMVELMDQLSASGQRIAYAAFDYVQLMDTGGAAEDNARIRRVLQAIKTFCADRSLIGVVGSQVTKADGRAATNGAKTGQHSMQYARSDVFNLVLSLSREVVNGEKSNTATVTISKNSLGRTGQTNLYLNTERMTWHDTK